MAKAILSTIQDIKQAMPQIFIPQQLLFLGKMHFPELFRIIRIIELFIPKLLARQIKYAVTNDIVTVIIAARTQDTTHFAAINVLRKKGRN